MSAAEIINAENTLDDYQERLAWKPFDETFVAGMHIATASRAELVEAMVSDCKAARELPLRARLIFDANGQGVSLYATSSSFKALLDAADVVHADGGFLVTASRKLTDRPILERSGTTDMIHDCAQGAVQHNLSFYLLGGSEEVNANCASILERTYPGLRIVGRRNGYFTGEQEDDVLADIASAAPDILWVGLGKPKEQEFCVRNARRIVAGWAITCGGCYNYITGDYTRAPLWMQKSNLEWLHRMATNPRKLFWRYLVTTPHALWLALTQTRRSIKL